LSPLKDLLAAIEADADEERSRLEAESAAEAEGIRRSAREEAEAGRAGILRPARAGSEAEANRRLARARLAAEAIRREAREEAFERLLADVRSELSHRREGAAYRDALRALISEGLAALPDARTLYTDPRDEALALALAQERGADLAVEPTLKTSGGVVLQSAGGRLVRNTFEERLAAAEPRLRLWYGRRLDALAPSSPLAGAAR
jgi:vacuolar-type H+-ATPase subunit E/Vma4